LKLPTLAILLLAVLFVAFFDASIHSPALARVNALAEDP